MEVKAKLTVILTTSDFCPLFCADLVGVSWLMFRDWANMSNSSTAAAPDPD